MKKRSIRKLTIDRETLRVLTSSAMERAAGARPIQSLDAEATACDTAIYSVCPACGGTLETCP